MYRNLVYYVDTENDWQGYIRLKTWDSTGKRIIQEFPHTSYVYYEDPEGEYRSFNGTKLKKKLFKNIFDRRRWMEQNRYLNYCECYDPKLEFLQAHFKGKNKDLPAFTKYKLHYCYIDIETEMGEEFEGPSTAGKPITVITIYDNYNDKYYTFALTDLDIESKPNLIYRKYKDESQMLIDFITLFKRLDFDCIVGYNNFSFDMPYIINRCKKILGEEIANTLSETGRFFNRHIKLQTDIRDYNGYTIPGYSIMDYFLLYKIFITPLEGEKPSYKLDNICQAELGYGKLEYEGSLKHLSKTDFKKFIEYNIRDVELLVELEKKRHLLELARMLSNLSLQEYDRVYNNMTTIIGNILQYTEEDNWHLPYDSSYLREEDDRSKEEINEGFIGALVREPQVGVYNGIAGFDVVSLYPNIMISLNIDPSTYLGKVVKDTSTDTYMIITKQGKIIEKDKSKIDQMMADQKIIQAGNGTLFTTEYQGIIPKFLQNGFNQRLKVKQTIKSLKKQIEIFEEEQSINPTIDHKEQIKNLKEQIKVQTLLSNVWKIVLNSTYGVSGNKFCPWYNKDLAEAVTLTGQQIVTKAGTFVNNYIVTHYQGNADLNYIIAGDTDSIYINIESICNYFYKKLLRECNKREITHIFHECVTMKNQLNEYSKSVMEKDYHALNINRIEFAFEIVADVGMFFKKKRYLLHIIYEDESRTNKFKYKGISLQRSTYPILTKQIVKTVYEQSILQNWNENTFRNFIEKNWQNFKTYDWNDIALHKSANVYREPLGFLTADKGTTGHAKALIYYNQLITKLGLTNKYDLISLNEKMRVIYILNNNEYNIEVIGFNQIIPDEFKKIFQINYIKMFELLVKQPLEDFCEIMKWQFPECQNEVQLDIMKI